MTEKQRAANRERHKRFRDKPENAAKNRSFLTQRRSMLKAHGICVVCTTKPAINKRSYCVDCKERSIGYCQQRAQTFLAQGLCGKCGKNPPLESMAVKNIVYKLCETCYFKKTARNRLGIERFWKFLKTMIEKQNYRCTYTGTRLILGVNDSLDHILPIRHYPELKLNLDNLEWVTREVNEMKSDRTPEEFLELIKTVLHYRRESNLTRSKKE